MCGRFSLGSTKESIQKLYGTQNDLPLMPRHNTSPGQQIHAIKLTDGKRTADNLTWGLIPAWAKDKSVGYKMINARGETVAEKPSFRSAYRSRRCLIPADGFYEWKTGARIGSRTTSTETIGNYFRLQAFGKFGTIWTAVNQSSHARS